MTQTETPDPQRVRASTRLTDAARISSLRPGHVIVHAETKDSNPRPPAPAWYDHKTGDASVHFDAAEVDLARWVAGDAEVKDHMRIMGLLTHELAHSKWSGWMDAAVRRACTSAELDVITLLEEIRVEQRAMSVDPDNREKFRAALPLAMKGLTEEPPTTRAALARCWALIYGRAITGVADKKELEWLDDACSTVLGRDDHDLLVDLLQEAVELDTTVYIGRMIEIAREWLEIVGSDDEDEEDGTGDCGRHGKTKKEEDEEESEGSVGGSDEEEEVEVEVEVAEGDDKEETKSTKPAESSSGEPSEGEKDEPSDDMSAGVAGSQERAEDNGEDESDSEPLSEDETELIKEVLERLLAGIDDSWDLPASDLADPREWAAKVFGSGRDSKRISQTTPSRSVRHHVTDTAAALQQLAIPAVTKVKTSAVLPPGRMKSREAVRRSAERSMGQIVTARPWEGTRRTHARVRPIVVGVATDTSGSMSWAAHAVAELVYIWTNAGQRVGARTAGLTFGDHVICTARPGKPLPTVPLKPANEGSENADRGLAALDGVLNLSSADGAAKLLVIVSDGHFVISGEEARVIKRLKDFKRAGTKVIWITPSRSHMCKEAAKQGLAEIIDVEESGIPGETTTDTIQRTVLRRIAGMTA